MRSKTADICKISVVSSAYSRIKTVEGQLYLEDKQNLSCLHEPMRIR